ncbi:MAG: hypothetical protein Q8L68_01465 [Methylococcales bacterium]|nr:hypothetical protein [Methylococcales bacterium]
MTTVTNNNIDVRTWSYGWTSFTTSITAVTTNPSLTITSSQSSYFQFGKQLFLIFQVYIASASPSRGNGVYLFNIPPGFTINTSIVRLVNNTATLGAVGGRDTNNGDNYLGRASAFDSTKYSMFIYDRATTADGSTYYISSSSMSAFTASPIVLSSNLTIPIN